MKHHGTALGLGYSKDREVEIRNRGYIIVEDVANPHTKTFSWDVVLTIDELES